MSAPIITFRTTIQHVEYAPDRIPCFRTWFLFLDMHSPSRVPFCQRQHPVRQVVADYALGDCLWLALPALTNTRQLKLHLVSITIKQTNPAPCMNRVRHSQKYGSCGVNRLHGSQHAWV